MFKKSSSKFSWKFHPTMEISSIPDVSQSKNPSRLVKTPGGTSTLRTFHFCESRETLEHGHDHVKRHLARQWRAPEVPVPVSREDCRCWRRKCRFGELTGWLGFLVGKEDQLCYQSICMYCIWVCFTDEKNQDVTKRLHTYMKRFYYKQKNKTSYVLTTVHIPIT